MINWSYVCSQNRQSIGHSWEIKVQWDFVSRFYKTRVSPGPRQMAAFWGGGGGALFLEKNPLVGAFIMVGQNATYNRWLWIQATREAVHVPQYWHMAPDSLTSLPSSCWALSPPAVTDLCLACPSSDRSLPSGGSPGLENTPITFCALGAPFQINSSTGTLQLTIEFHSYNYVVKQISW